MAAVADWLSLLLFRRALFPPRARARPCPRRRRRLVLLAPPPLLRAPLFDPAAALLRSITDIFRNCRRCLPWSLGRINPCGRASRKCQGFSSASPLSPVATSESSATSLNSVSASRRAWRGNGRRWRTCASSWRRGSGSLHLTRSPPQCRGRHPWSPSRTRRLFRLVLHPCHRGQTRQALGLQPTRQRASLALASNARFRARTSRRTSSSVTRPTSCCIPGDWVRRREAAFEARAARLGFDSVRRKVRLAAR